MAPQADLFAAGAWGQADNSSVHAELVHQPSTQDCSQCALGYTATSMQGSTDQAQLQRRVMQAQLLLSGHAALQHVM